MDAQQVDSFVDFVKRSDNMDLVAETMLYRGQDVRGNLLPAVARADPAFDTTDEEKVTLQELKYLGASLLPEGQSDMDLLVRAQHFGLKTRLLDWTSNSLAALWFACSGRKKGDAYVYALAADHLINDTAAYGADPFRAAKTRVFRPRLNNQRILAQHGWFTLHKYSKSAQRFVALEANPDTQPKLTEFVIAARSRQAILQSLDRHGVSARTLVPDLNGLCLYLNWRSAAQPRVR